MSVSFSDMGHGVRLIRFSGQSATQSFSRTFLPEIAKAIDDGITSPDVRALVLTGEGKFFSAGADINAFAKSIDDGDAPHLAAPIFLPCLPPPNLRVTAPAPG